MNPRADTGFRRLYQRVMGVLNRGKVLLVDDSKAEVQLLQVDLGPKGDAGSLGIRDKTPRLADYGFSSNPPKGSHVIVLALGGERTDAVAIATGDPAHRFTGLEEGETVLYDKLRGTFVHLAKDGIVIDGGGLPVIVQNATTVTVKASTKVRLETPRLEVTGDIVDNCDSQAVTLKQLRDDYNAHQHGGVTDGSAKTATTDHPAT